MWILEQLEELRFSAKAAVIHGDCQLSFQELWQRSEALSVFLEAEYQKRHLPKTTPVVIYGAKQSDILAVMHAALKIGVPYVPVDTLYPVERLLHIIGQVQAWLVFNFSSRPVKGAFRVVETACLSKLYEAYQGQKSCREHWVKPEDVCYILFTSGSTGKPKGVQIARRNIECFVDWYKEFCPVDDATVALNQVSYSFDVSVMPLYIYLAQGATLLSVDAEMLSDFKVLEQVFAASNLTDWVSTPALFDICVFADAFNGAVLPKLKRFSFAGEIMTKKLVQTVWDRFGQDAEVINGYGPTETTVLLTACKVTTAMMEDEDSIPIGTTNPALGYRIADEQGNAVKPGDKGELLVWGGSIGCGYYQNPEQTAQNFFQAEDGSRGYRTGDLVYEKNGFIYYAERRDFQLKLNGYRIEPDDISSNINDFPYVQNSLVLPVKEDGKISYLAAYVQLRESEVETSALKLAIRIKKDLKEVVPVYMIPKKIIIVKRFPLNVNGKIDRKKLLEEIQ